MATEQVSSKKAYLHLKDLIRKDEVLLIIHNRYKGIRKLIIYACCGISFKYFEKAYKTEKVALQVGAFGPIIGAPIPWQSVLPDYSERENQVHWCKTCRHFKRVAKYEDELFLSHRMIPDSAIPCKQFDDVEDVWTEYFDLPAGERTLYPKGCPKWKPKDKELSAVNMKKGEPSKAEQTFLRSQRFEEGKSTEDDLYKYTDSKLPRQMESLHLGSPIEEFLKKRKYIRIPEHEAKEYYFPNGLYWGQEIFILDEQLFSVENKEITLTFNREKLFSIAVTTFSPSSPWQKFVAGHIAKYGQPEEEEGTYFWEDERTQICIGKVEALGTTAFNVIIYDKTLR